MERLVWNEAKKDWDVDDSPIVAQDWHDEPIYADEEAFKVHGQYFKAEDSEEFFAYLLNVYNGSMVSMVKALSSFSVDDVMYDLLHDSQIHEQAFMMEYLGGTII